MKRISWLMTILLVFSLLVAGLAPGGLAQAQDTMRVAKIIATQGDVKILRAGGERAFPAFKGIGLTQGDSIVTGKDGKATLEVGEDREMTIAANTRIMLSELVQSLQENTDQTSFTLKAGKVYCNIKKKLSPGSKYEIRTPTAVMGVRGTQFFVGQEEGRTNVAVLDGTVVATTYVPPQQPGGQPSGQQPPEPQQIETILQTNQQLTLDPTGGSPGGGQPQQITQASLDLLVLESIRENPQGIDQNLLLNIDQIIEQRQEEQQQQQQQQQQRQEEQPQRIIEHEDGNQEPGGTGNNDEDNSSRRQAVKLNEISNESTAVGRSIIKLLSVIPADANISYSISPTSGVLDVIYNDNDKALEISGVSLGTAEVTVTAAKTGYRTASRTFTVTVIPSLDQVDQPGWDGPILYWNDVSNALSYQIKLYRDGEPAYSCEQAPGVGSVELSAYLIESGRYTATVIAKGDGITYANGEESVVSLEYIVGPIETAGYMTGSEILPEDVAFDTLISNNTGKALVFAIEGWDLFAHIVDNELSGEGWFLEQLNASFIDENEDHRAHAEINAERKLKVTSEEIGSWSKVVPLKLANTAILGTDLDGTEEIFSSNIVLTDALIQENYNKALLLQVGSTNYIHYIDPGTDTVGLFMYGLEETMGDVATITLVDGKLVITDADLEITNNIVAPEDGWDDFVGDGVSIVQGQGAPEH